ncbi:MAG: helix-turn-helix domain-containing protein [Treponema sp.]|nr:helix-turn-helix domain-containing protein [Treponema sp.]
MEIADGIHERIIKIRKFLGLTQKDFAEKINISKAYVGAIELNRRKINERIIRIICFTYNINETWLKNGTGTMFNETNDGKLEEVIHNFKKLDELLQDYVLKQIQLALEYQEQKGKN